MIFLEIMKPAVASLNRQGSRSSHSFGSDVHERNDENEHQYFTSIESIRAFQIEDLTCKNDRLVNDWQP